MASIWPLSVHRYSSHAASPRMVTSSCSALEYIFSCFWENIDKERDRQHRTNTNFAATPKASRKKGLTERRDDIKNCIFCSDFTIKYSNPFAVNLTAPIPRFSTNLTVRNTTPFSIRKSQKIFHKLGNVTEYSKFRKLFTNFGADIGFFYE